MYEYIYGKVAELNPAYVVIESSNIGYIVHISLYTYSVLEREETYKLYTHQIVREDTNMLFGFADKSEREIFRLLISVSGIGANTARVMLSSLKAGEIKKAIRTDDVNTLKSVKGIGAKTAQRVIIDLKDKIDKTEVDGENTPIIDTSASSEALSALTMLGFPKAKTEKAVNSILSKEKDITVEELVKKALKIL
ncbi:MAG: Holliday junction branch migration protein RuvA [Bacteroidales bacterium]|nr:Holliday junction branch migration protein RuvA [Bacteroidales bacterium]